MTQKKIKINEKYLVCEIAGETFILPEEFDKKDMTKVERLTGSAAAIIKEIEQGVNSTQELKDKICRLYGSNEEERELVCKSVDKFIDMCLNKGYCSIY